MTTKFDVSQGTLLEGFEDSTEWTASGGTVANDTTYVKQGTNSLKLTSGSGTNCIATKTIATTVSDPQSIYLWVYIEDISQVVSLQVILSPTTDFASYFSKTVSSGNLHEKWNKIMIGRNQWAATGTPDWASEMVRLRVRVNAQTSVSPVVYYDSMYYGYIARPKCIITYDDGWQSQFTYGYQYMRKFGFKGTTYIIPDKLDTENYCTTAQIQELYDEGWDISSHHSTNFTTLADQAEVESTIAGIKSFIVSNGWSRRNSELHLAYPNGGYNTDVLSAMEAGGMITGRTIINRTQSHEIDEPHLLLRQSIIHTTTLGTSQGYIDRTIADNGTILLNFHKLEVDTADVDTEILVSMFEDIIDYLDANRAAIDVVTLTEWYRGISEARRLV